MPVAAGELVRATFAVAYGRLLTGVRLSARLVGPEGARSVRFRNGTFATEGEGEYLASFRAPRKAGVYALTLTAANDRTRTRFASREGGRGAAAHASAAKLQSAVSRVACGSPNS